MAGETPIYDGLSAEACSRTCLKRLADTLSAIWEEFDDDDDEMQAVTADRLKRQHREEFEEAYYQEVARHRTRVDEELKNEFRNECRKNTKPAACIRTTRTN